MLHAGFVVLAFIIGLSSGYLIWGSQTSKSTGQAVAQGQTTQHAPTQPDPGSQIQVPTPPQGPVRIDVSVDDDPAFGPPDAPITIIEFSDFRCPYCQKFHHETLPGLIASYPDQIRFVYRDFPVVGGFEAAMAAECADEQGAFWEFHDLLFSGELPLERSGYLAYAEQLELDTDALTDCLDSQRYASEVNADANYAASLGITGTPTFFINGIPLIGARPLAHFKQVIDGELEQ